jgi:hypothetical protein
MIFVNFAAAVKPIKAAGRTDMCCCAPMQWSERKGKSTSFLCPSDVTPYCMR